MTDHISEQEIRRIVQNVVSRSMGKNPAASSSNQPDMSGKTTKKFVVAIGTDHGGVDLKEILKKDLLDNGYEVIDVGTHTKDAVDYPDIALAVAQKVASGEACRGVIIDGAGIGSCMAANKVPGIRAALCYDYATAVNSREHNKANVLTLGAGLIGTNLAKQILNTWLTTEFGGDRHARRIDKITAIEKRFTKDGK
ncbi:MAG: ribose 5-phosphate isomerase B [Brevefilum sp.]|jgi:ribose 5-phosphate isomerase B